jgi:hypothetical protein
MIELAQYTTESDSASAVWGLLVAVGLAVICGAWTADAAERKGISRGTGWALGLLLGLVGRIIVGVMRDRRNAQPGPVQWAPTWPAHGETHRVYITDGGGQFIWLCEDCDFRSSDQGGRTGAYQPAQGGESPARAGIATTTCPDCAEESSNRSTQVSLLRL